MSISGRNKKYLAMLTGVVVSLLSVFLIYSYVLLNQLFEQGKIIFDDLNEVNEHVYTAINSLNAQGFSSCTDENLASMRLHQFKSNDIRDIGFYENNFLICTSGLGKLKTPINEPSHDFVFNGYEYWFSYQLHTFAEGVFGLAIRKENYNVITSFDGFFNKTLRFKDYELIFRNNAEIIHLYGKQDVFKQLSVDLTKNFSIGLLSKYIEFCGPSGNVCIAIEQQFFSEYQIVPVLVILILISVISAIAFLHTYEVLNRYIYSTKRRVKIGLSRNRIHPHYQAIIDLKSGRVIGCELLARFKDKLGNLYPDEFIPIVAELDQSWKMTKSLILQALKDFKDIRPCNTPFYLSINVFPKDINNANILKGIKLLKNSSEFLQICFEVTEDEELDFSKVAETLETLYNSHIKVSIDDFGTGYSNLAQLKLLKIDTLKIDKSFVDEVESGSIRSTFIPNIVSIARKLDATIIAEGIENKLQVEEFIKMDIEFGQGWYYSKALPLKEFKTYLINNSDYKFNE
ncbi:MAG: EAL domain-containing protein [Saccharospirillaceae bacterium]|nr:EAL domain-containing protein [Pseudomonadales bacterium]NRB78426.1 EAL domain-containing protein [Saccharospirillaceae bacterium]